ncbi:uncharacterized protein ACNLHF_013365 [Anomaloglossus baeobatrachus]
MAKEQPVSPRKFFKTFGLKGKDQLDPNKWDTITSTRAGVIADKSWTKLIRTFSDMAKTAHDQGWIYHEESDTWEEAGKQANKDPQPPPYLSATPGTTPKITGSPEWTCTNCGQQNPDWSEKCLACGAPQHKLQATAPVPLYPVVERRVLIRPPVNPQNPDAPRDAVPCTYDDYVPWTPAQQMAFLQNAPDPTRNPVSFSRYLNQIQVSYRSTWLDMEGLCRVKMSPELYAKLTAHLTGHVPDDTRNVESGQDFMIRLNLFCAQEQRTKGTMGPVHQGPVENVSSFYYRLMQSFADEGLDLQAGAIRRLMVRSFMDGIHAPLAERLKACCPEWRNMEDIDLLVNKASGLETDAKDKRSNKKVVIAAVDGQPEGTRKKAPTCYYCGVRGHVIRDCRKKKRDTQNRPESQEEKTA